MIVTAASVYGTGGWASAASSGLRTLAAVAIVSLSCAGSRPAPTPTFVVEVLGAREPLDRFHLEADGMEADPALTFEGSALMRRVRSQIPWPALDGRDFPLTAREGERETGRVRLRPFLCAENTAFAQRLATGWRAQETHQVALSAAGTLDAVPDFTRPLSFRCDWTPPRGMSEGQGSSAPLPSLPLCQDPDRSATALTFRGTLRGQAIDVRPRLCQAVLTDRFDGVLTISVTTPTPAGELAVSVGHCLAGPQGSAEVFPMVLDLTPAAAPCRFSADLSLLDARGNTSVPAAAGHLQLDEAAYTKGGRVRGRLELEFQSNADRLVVSGVIDLPIVRIPVEFDWKDPS